MKELTVLSTNGVVIQKCLVDVEGKDFEINFHTPLYAPLVSISLTEEKKEKETFKQKAEAIITG